MVAVTPWTGALAKARFRPIASGSDFSDRRRRASQQAVYPFYTSGLCWPWLGKLPIGRLPGDIAIERPGFRFYLPLASTLVLSALLSLVMWLTRR